MPAVAPRTPTPNPSCLAKEAVKYLERKGDFSMLPAVRGPSANSCHFGKTKYPFFCKRIHRLVEGSKSARRFDIAPTLHGCREGRAKDRRCRRTPPTNGIGSGAGPAPAATPACRTADRQFPVPRHEFPVRRNKFPVPCCAGNLAPSHWNCRANGRRTSSKLPGNPQIPCYFPCFQGIPGSRPIDAIKIST